MQNAKYEMQSDRHGVASEIVRRHRRHPFCTSYFALCILHCLILLVSQSVPSFAQEPAAPPAASVDAKPVEPPPPTPLELQPYRVRISVAFDEHPSLTARVRQEVLSELASWVDRTFGEMWIASIEENRWLAPENEEGLSRLKWASLETQLADKELDKAFVLCEIGRAHV